MVANVKNQRKSVKKESFLSKKLVSIRKF